MRRRREVKATIKSRELVRERRERLVKAAIDVFQRKGFHTATVRDIGVAAGLTQGTIYNYVRSKDDILYLVCDHLVAAYQERVMRALSGINHPGSRLDAALSALVEAMYEHQDGILLIYHESHVLDRKSLRALLGRVSDFIRFFEDILAEADISRGRSAMGMHLIANIVTFLPTIVALRRWDLKAKVSHSGIVRGLTDFMLRGLGLGTPQASGTARRRADQRHTGTRNRAVSRV